MEMGRRTPWRTSLLAARKLGQRLPSPKLDAMPPWFLAGSQNLGRALVGSYRVCCQVSFHFFLNITAIVSIGIGLISIFLAVIYLFIAYLLSFFAGKAGNSSYYNNPMWPGMATFLNLRRLPFSLLGLNVELLFLIH